MTFPAWELIRNGHEAYLSYILDTRVSKSKIDQISIDREFADVFLEEFSSLPLEREVELAIEVVSGSALISIVPYRMA